MNKLKNLTDKHKEFIELNPWLSSINFTNIDIIECKTSYLYCFIKSLIEYKVIQCNILISNYENRYYYNGKHYFNKVRYVSENNRIYDYLRDSEGNYLFWCEDKNDYCGGYKHDFKPYNDFYIIEFNKDDLIITYINENE